MRPLDTHEISIITAVASNIDANTRQRLLSDLNHAEVDDKLSTDVLTRFSIKSRVRRLYEGQHTYGIDGLVQDVDGANISILLFADSSGRLLEMEFIRWDGRPIVSPNWASLVVDKSCTAQPLVQ